jgi:xylose isomerase
MLEKNELPLLGDCAPQNKRRTTLEMLLCLRKDEAITGLRLHCAAKTIEDFVVGLVRRMDAYALGLQLAVRLRLDGRIDNFRRDWYADYAFGMGKSILDGKLGLAALENHALAHGEPTPRSDREEYLEEILQSLLFRNFT